MGKRYNQAKTAFERFLPKYARIPLLLVLGFNFLVYFATKLFVDYSDAFDLSIWLDTVIPFSTVFITFYVGAYLQWGLSYIAAGRESREFCYRIVTADLVSKIFCFLFFVFMPTAIVRPEVTGNSVLDYLTRVIYAMDTPPVNLFPSIHCLESWVAIRCAFSMKKVGKVYRAITVFVSVGVFMSVVFLKQHYLVDIPAGILVFELALLLTKKFRLDRFLDRGMKFIKR